MSGFARTVIYSEPTVDELCQEAIAKRVTHARNMSEFVRRLKRDWVQRNRRRMTKADINVPSDLAD